MSRFSTRDYRRSGIIILSDPCPFTAVRTRLREAAQGNWRTRAISSAEISDQAT